MSRSQALLLAALACVLAVPLGCSTSAEPPSGETRTKQDRDRANDVPDGVTRGGGGGGGY
jgi:hypothetical protein